MFARAYWSIWKLLMLFFLFLLHACNHGFIHVCQQVLNQKASLGLGCGSSDRASA
jgi:hypothetical protein